MRVIIGSNVEDLFLSVLASLVVSGCVLSRGGLFVPGAALHFPVSSLPTCSALGIFCWAGGAPWGVMLGAVSTGVLLLLFLSLSLSLSFPLAFLWGSLAYSVDILELPRPMASISPLMAMWVLHVSNILAVIAVIGIARSFFTSSRSSRA